MFALSRKWSAASRLRLAALLLAFALLPQAEAASPALQEKAGVFSSIFHGSTSPQFHYHAGYCSSNILNLYFIFGNLGISREGDKVAVIFEQDRSLFVAQNARLSETITRPPNFTFHVIYISEGYVFDFDHGQQPAVERIEEYLAKQFPAGGPGNKRLLARIYSPGNYLKAYNGPAGNPLILDPQNLSEKLVDLHSLTSEQ